MEKYLVIIIILVFRSCSTNPRAINYNTDNCSYCKMTIVDQIHATELVTEKGRIKVYDAIECMLYDLKENPSVKLIFVEHNTFRAGFRTGQAGQLPRGLHQFHGKQIVRKNVG